MGRPKKQLSKEIEGTHMGNVLRDSLIRLGYVEKRVSLAKIAEVIKANTGENISRQRLYNILESPTITPKALATLAKGLGLTELELLTGQAEQKEGKRHK
jgi:hypothetical protein